MTEPTPESNESPLTVLDAPSQEVDETEGTPTPYAASYLVTVPRPGTSDLDVQWGQPHEGQADSFVLEVGPNSYDVLGTTTRVLIEGLQPNVDFPVRLTSFLGSNSGTLEIPTVQVQEPVSTQAPVEDTTPPADDTPQEG